MVSFHMLTKANETHLGKKRGRKRRSKKSSCQWARKQEKGRGVAPLVKKLHSPKGKKGGRGTEMLERERWEGKIPNHH